MFAITFDINEALVVLKPLMLFVAVMVIYSIFIFKFYRFLARKDIFKLNLNQYNRAKHPLFIKTLSVIFYLIEYILLFPLFAFFWFAVFVVLLSFMAKNQPIESIMLVSISVVGVVRVTAYYNEDLSKDLAKMLPFALLGIFLLDISFFSFSESIETLKQIPTIAGILIYYLTFIISLEFILRIGSGLFFHKKDKKEEQPPVVFEEDLD
ncbi:MAG: hypothetical protein DRN66_02855 [Candidatus Nanohalarchaeota archaeon]|nr:MAG: hypothetical protein DRN66_02855 [Candidatus Nanohaloarchaeota archaeon]